MNQRNLIFGFGSGRPLGGLNLPVGKLACTEASGRQYAEGIIL
jgi:hypothetical protein